MRMTLLAATLAGLIGAMGNAVAADPSQRAPTAAAFVEFDFGGADATPSDSSLRYGLQLDHDRRFADVPAAPMFRMAFTPAGFSSAALNGLPFAYRSTTVSQTGEALEYTVFDYGLVALGAVGIGFAVAEIVDADDETPDPTPTEIGDGENSGEGGLIGDIVDGVGDVVDGILGGGFRSTQASSALDRSHQPAWLSADFGQMGDLDSHR